MTENPIVDAIPRGVKITIILRCGHRYTGVNKTTSDEAETGVFVIGWEKKRDSGMGFSQLKARFLSSEVIGFEQVLT
jgi:hypothetical protein